MLYLQELSQTMKTINPKVQCVQTQQVWLLWAVTSSPGYTACVDAMAGFTFHKERENRGALMGDPHPGEGRTVLENNYSRVSRF